MLLLSNVENKISAVLSANIRWRKEIYPLLDNPLMFIISVCQR